LFVGLYGHEATLPVGVAILCGNLVAVPLTLLLLETKNAQTTSASILRRYAAGLAKSLRNAIVLAPAFGLCFSLAGYTLPLMWVRSFGFLAESVAGVALFVTGIVLSRESVTVDHHMLSGLSLRLIIQPLLTFVIALLLNCPGLLVRDAVLLMSCPGGFLGVLLGIAFHARTREAGSVLLLSTAASGITLAIVILLLPFIK
jgi:predicted permease